MEKLLIIENLGWPNERARDVKEKLAFLIFNINKIIKFKNPIIVNLYKDNSEDDLRAEYTEGVINIFAKCPDWRGDFLHELSHQLCRWENLSLGIRVKLGKMKRELKKNKGDGRVFLLEHTYEKESEILATIFKWYMLGRVVNEGYMEVLSNYQPVAITIMNKIISKEKLEKSIDLTKSKRLPIGTVKDWRGKKYKKVAEGKWQEVKKEKKKIKIYSLEDIRKIQTLGMKSSDIIFDAKKGDKFVKKEIEFNKIKGGLSYEEYTKNSNFEESLGIIHSLIDKIKSGGKLSPIVVDENNKIMDGLHRKAVYDYLNIKNIEVLKRVKKIEISDKKEKNIIKTKEKGIEEITNKLMIEKKKEIKEKLGKKIAKIKETANDKKELIGINKKIKKINIELKELKPKIERSPYDSKLKGRRRQLKEIKELVLNRKVLVTGMINREIRKEIEYSKRRKIEKSKYDKIYSDNKNLLKSKSLPIGTMKNWKGGKFKKVAKGKWQLVGEIGKKKNVYDKNIANLSDEKAEVKSIEWYGIHKKELKSQYLKENKVVMDSDIARSFFKPIGYNVLNAAKYHEAASIMTNEMWDSEITKRKGKGNNTVLLTAGSPGAGKTTAVEIIAKDKDQYPLIYDSTMSSKSGSIRRIESALKNGYKAEVIVVVRSAEKAWASVLERTASGRRHVPLEHFLRMSGNYPKTILNLHRKYKNKVNFIIVENMGDLKDIRKSSINTLKNYLFDKEKMKEKLKIIAKEMVKDGKIKKESIKEVY